MKKERKQYHSITAATKQNNVPRNTFNPGCKKLYSKNHKTVKTEIEENTNKWKHIPGVHG